VSSDGRDGVIVAINVKSDDDIKLLALAEELICGP
jgi:hypothetical protein